MSFVDKMTHFEPTHLLIQKELDSIYLSHPDFFLEYSYLPTPKAFAHNRSLFDLLRILHWCAYSQSTPLPMLGIPRHITAFSVIQTPSPLPNQPSSKSSHINHEAVCLQSHTLVHNASIHPPHLLPEYK